LISYFQEITEFHILRDTGQMKRCAREASSKKGGEKTVLPTPAAKTKKFSPRKKIKEKKKGGSTCENASVWEKESRRVKQVC
jgi:hypothetical protein